MQWLVPVILLAGLFILLTVMKAALSKGEQALGYVQRKEFVSAAERSFYGVLAQAIGDRYKLHTKVRVADVLEPVKGATMSLVMAVVKKATSSP